MNRISVKYFGVDFIIVNINNIVINVKKKWDYSYEFYT